MTIRFLDPTGERYGIPTYPYRLAPAGLFTACQLAEMGFRPGFPAAPDAQLMWLSSRRGTGTRTAYLYWAHKTVQKTPATGAQLAALERANAVRMTCLDCGRNVGYVIPVDLGACLDCGPSYRKAVA